MLARTNNHKRHAGTESPVSMRICSSGDKPNCCDTGILSSWSEKDPRKYFDWSDMGRCNRFAMDNVGSVSVTIHGTDFWLGSVIMIWLNVPSEVRKAAGNMGRIISARYYGCDINSTYGWIGNGGTQTFKCEKYFRRI